MPYRISNPELADNVLKYLLEHYDTYTGPIALGKELRENDQEVKLAIEEIKRMHISWLDDAIPYGDEPIMIKASFAQLRLIREWLQKGGFTELIRDQTEKEQKARKLEELDIESKRIQIAGTKKAMADADKALEIALAAQQASSEANTIAHTANELARSAKTAGVWAAIISAIISSFLTWYLTKP